MKVIKGEKDQTKRVTGQLRLLNRVLMSYIDFQQAGAIARHILDLKLHERQPQDRFLLQGLNSGLIVAYCRPFLDSKRHGGTKVPRLPTTVLRIFTTEERELHVVVMDDRNTVIAHSDPDVWELEPEIYRFRDGDELLIPVHKDVHAPLTREATELLGQMCEKLKGWCFAERLRLEPELKPYFTIVEYDQEEIAQLTDETGPNLPPAR